MSKTKKAQGLSLNMIVVGAIGLVVLVVIIAIFVSSAQKSQKDIDAKQKGLDCSKATTTPFLSAITHPADCTKVGGEILIGKYFGTLHKSSEVMASGAPSGVFVLKEVSPIQSVDSDGMSYVCCKYKT